MRKIPGIYVEIRGDFSDLKNKVSEAKKKVTEQARGMSDALNNALAPEQIKANVNGLVVTLGSLSRSAHLSSQNFAKIGVDLGKLQGITGITSAEFAKLQSRMLETRAAGVQEKALKDLARAAGFSREEIKSMGTQFGLNVGQIDKVTAALHGAEAKVTSLSARIAAMPLIKPSSLVSGEAQIEVSGATGSAVKSFATDLTALSQGGAIAGRAMDALSLDMAELRKHTGMADAQFSKLQSQFSRTHNEKVQSNALLNIARSAGLTEKEMRSLGRQMNVSKAIMDKTAASMNNVGKSTEFSMMKFKDMIITVGIYTAAFQAVTKMIDGLKAVVNYNATIEVSQLGIASAFLTAGKYVDSTTGKVLEGAAAFKEAQIEARGIIEELKAANLETIATLDQLVRAYQETLPVAMRAGFDKSQVQQFTSAMIQAAGAIDASGALMHQLGEETRSIMTGTINPRTSRIATVLGITNDDVKKFKGDADGMFNFLMDKLSSYRSAGVALQGTWKGVMSNLVDVAQQVGGMVGEPIFNKIKLELKDVVDSIVVMDEKTKKMKWSDDFLKDVESIKSGAEGIVDAYEVGKKLADEYGESLVRLVTLLVEVKVAQLALNLAMKINPWYAAAAAVAAYAHHIGVLAPTLKIAVQAIDEVIGKLAALYEVATRKDKSMWDWITTGSDGLKEWQEELTNGIAPIKEKLAELKEARNDAMTRFVFTDAQKASQREEIDEIDQKTAALYRQIDAIKSKDGLLMSGHGSRADDGMMPTSNHGGVKYVPNPPPAEDGDKGGGTSLASDMNAALKAQVAYLKAAEEKKAAIIKAAAALELQANQNAYDTGLRYYRDYLATKQKYTEEALQADLSAKQKELAEAQAAVKKLTPITDKEGNARPDKNAKAYSDALKQVEVAEKAAIESANKLKLAQVDGATEAAQAISDNAAAYREIHIQMLEMTGQTVAAAQARAQADSETVERSRLIIAAKMGEVGAVQALADVEQMARDAIKATELDKMSIAKDTLAGIAEMNGEYYKSRDIQIELLNIEIERAKLFGALPEQIALLERQRKALEDLQDPSQAFISTWQSMAGEWGDTAMHMVDVATASAQAMQGAFSDIFFDAMNGKLKDFRDYATALLSDISRAIANAMAQKIVSTAIAGVFHTGGVVGVDSSPMRVASTNIAALPRHHTGLGSNEFLSVLERGETVFTKGQMKSLGEAVKSGRSDEKSSNVSNNTVNQTIKVEGRIDRRTSTQLANDAARKQRVASARFG